MIDTRDGVELINDMDGLVTSNRIERTDVTKFQKCFTGKLNNDTEPVQRGPVSDKKIPYRKY